jgi:hypothetical protein
MRSGWRLIATLKRSFAIVVNEPEREIEGPPVRRPFRFMLRSGAGTYPRQRFVFTAGSKPLAAGPSRRCISALN